MKQLDTDDVSLPNGFKGMTSFNNHNEMNKLLLNLFLTFSFALSFTQSHCTLVLNDTYLYDK